MWLLVALSVGGIAVALERAIYLIRTSENVASSAADPRAASRGRRRGGAGGGLARSRRTVAGIIAAGLENTRTAPSRPRSASNAPRSWPSCAWSAARRRGLALSPPLDRGGQPSGPFISYRCRFQVE